MGSGFTVTIPCAGTDVHELAAVTVTVYVVVLAGDTVIEDAVEPVLHKYVMGCSPPVTVAVSVAEPPGQMLSEFTDTCGVVKKFPNTKSLSSAVTDEDALVSSKKDVKHGLMPPSSPVRSIPPSKKLAGEKIFTGPVLGTYGQGE